MTREVCDLGRTVVRLRRLLLLLRLLLLMTEASRCVPAAASSRRYTASGAIPTLAAALGAPSTVPAIAAALLGQGSAIGGRRRSAGSCAVAALRCGHARRRSAGSCAIAALRCGHARCGAAVATGGGAALQRNTADESAAPPTSGQ